MIQFEDDAKEKEITIIRHRLPWLLLGLIGGIIATIFTSKFELILQTNIQLAYFIPVIVYMSDALGTQTETIYIRNLVSGKAKFSTYFLKELFLGLTLGMIFGFLLFIFSYIWFKSSSISLTVGLAMFITMATSPIIAISVATLLYKEKTDPAIGGGPFTTILQDILSILIYFSIASLIIL